MKLRKQRRFNPLACLISLPQVISERFYYMVSCNTNVRCTLFDHLQYPVKHTCYSPEWFILSFVEPPQTVEVTVKLISSIDKMYNHSINFQRLIYDKNLY